MKKKKFIMPLLIFLCTVAVTFGVRRIIIDQKISRDQDRFSLLGTKCTLENASGQKKETDYARVGTWLVRQYNWQKISMPDPEVQPAYTINVYPDDGSQSTAFTVYDDDTIHINQNTYRLSTPEATDNLISYLNTVFQSGK